MVSQAELILRVITLWFLVLSNFFRDGMGPLKPSMIEIWFFCTSGWLIKLVKNNKLNFLCERCFMECPDITLNKN